MSVECKILRLAAESICAKDYGLYYNDSTLMDYAAKHIANEICPSSPVDICDDGDTCIPVTQEVCSLTLTEIFPTAPTIIVT